MWIFGIILILLSLGTTYGYFNQRKKVEEMQSTETATVEFLHALAENMRDSVGEGSFRYGTEVKGRVACEEPLVSELAGVECVHYSMTIKRRYEEVYYEEDSDGRSHRRVRSSTETVTSNKRTIPFMVEDGTGSIRVEADSAEIVSESVLSRYEPAEEGRGGLQIGSFHLDLPTMSQEGSRRTLGHEFEEYAIPVNTELYVLGEATTLADGQLCIRKPADEKKFIVSTKSEEELTRKKQASMRGFLMSSILLVVVGVVLIIVGLVKK